MTVGIVGLGLIGGSVGLALRQARHTVIGFETSTAHAKTAVDRGCVDAIEPLAAVARADVVFVCVPPGAVIDTLRAMFAAKRPETIVTDCASVKSEIIEWVEKNLAKEPNFVGGHPMAGHERSGPAYASAWMFRNARWLLTPTKPTSKDALKVVESLIKEMGAAPVRIDPKTHDRHVAILSHLPHAVAAVLVELASGLERTDIVGGSWRDLTRVGGADPQLWTQILVGNREELVAALGEAEERLAGLRKALESADDAAVRAFFESARMAKERNEA